MAIGVYFAPALRETQYDQCIEKNEPAGAGMPAGRQYHACLATRPRCRSSAMGFAATDHFGETLMPILREIGADPVQPQIMPILNIIKG